MFPFSIEKFEFDEIENAIRQCYTSNTLQKGKNEYGEYSTSEELISRIVEHYSDNGPFFQRWASCKNQINSDTGLTVQNRTSTQTPCLHAFITLDKQAAGNFTRAKEVHFYISITGRFFTVIGQDNSYLVVDNKHFQSTTCLILSPVDEYEYSFLQVIAAIGKTFPEYRFVPFSVYRLPLENMETGYMDEAPANVFEAIFDRSVQIHKYTGGLGEPFFKNEDWIRPDYVHDGSYWVGVNPFLISDNPETGHTTT